MRMTLERFVLLMNTKFNLKRAAEKLGFNNINGVLFIRESDNAYIKFDDEETMSRYVRDLHEMQAFEAPEYSQKDF